MFLRDLIEERIPIQTSELLGRIREVPRLWLNHTSVVHQPANKRVLSALWPKLAATPETPKSGNLAQKERQNGSP